MSKRIKKFNENFNKIKVDFNLCIDVEILIDFIEQNSNFEWNELCEMEYRYQKSGDFDNETYPIINLDEQDDTKFQYWCEKFLECYKDEIGDKTVYILHD
jgi:hypothetical protein